MDIRWKTRNEGMEIKVTKYFIVNTDVCGDVADNIVIVGGHFVEEKAKQILVKKEYMEKTDEIMELHYGYAKRVYNLDEIYPCAESSDGWELDWTSEPPEDFDKQITVVEISYT